MLSAAYRNAWALNSYCVTKRLPESRFLLFYFVPSPVPLNRWLDMALIQLIGLMPSRPTIVRATKLCTSRSYDIVALVNL